MARNITLTDDVDGSTEGVQERKFSYGDNHYVIDLSEANYIRLISDLEYWRSRARVERKGGMKLSAEDRAAIRKYAEETGRPIKERGRFPHAIITEYFNQLTA